MPKKKMLVINKQNPSNTTYMSPKAALSFLKTRRISNYLILVVGVNEDTSVRVIPFESLELWCSNTESTKTLFDNI